jgi:hypothetical protein
VWHHSYERITGKRLNEHRLIKAAFKNEVVKLVDTQTSDSREFGASSALMQLSKKCGLDKVPH